MNPNNNDDRHYVKGFCMGMSVSVAAISLGLLWTTNQASQALLVIHGFIVVAALIVFVHIFWLKSGKASDATKNSS